MGWIDSRAEQPVFGNHHQHCLGAYMYNQAFLLLESSFFVQTAAVRGQ